MRMIVRHCIHSVKLLTDTVRMIAGLPGKYREEELARLLVILVTPDPPTGVNNTSASADWTTIYGTIAKDALLFTLECIVQASDVFPPLKSAASGLLFFATSADVSLYTVYMSAYRALTS